MHELTLCRYLIEIVEHEANLRNVRRIHKIYLEIGKLAAIEKKAFLFAFDVASKDTIANNARLEIIEVDGAAHCHHCNKVTKLSQRYSSCQFCDNFNLTMIAGEELKIKSMEVE